MFSFLLNMNVFSFNWRLRFDQRLIARDGETAAENVEYVFFHFSLNNLLSHKKVESSNAKSA